jgi:hypothetical protein
MTTDLGRRGSRPQWLHRDAGRTFREPNDSHGKAVHTQRSAAQVGAAVAAVVALLFAGYSQRSTDRQLKINPQGQRLTEQGQITEDFNRTDVNVGGSTFGSSIIRDPDLVQN